MPIKGYVVRWTDADGACELRPTPLDVALRAWRSQAAQKDTRIFTVAEDRAETPLPSYEEALAERERILAATETFQFASETGVRNPVDRVEMVLAWREAIARQRDEARAEILTLKAQIAEESRQMGGLYLAWREVLRRLSPVAMHESTFELARLAGIRDTWKTEDPDWDIACAIAEALAFVPLDSALKMGPFQFMSLANDIGPILVRKAREAAEHAAETAVRYSLGGQRVAVIDDHRVISDAAEYLGSGADIVVSFEYVHDAANRVHLVVHLRSRGAVNVQAIARRFGGNGHREAAGFSEPVDDHSVGISPYEVVYRRLSAALENGHGMAS